MVLSNTRHSPHGTRADLGSTYSSFSTRHFFQPTPHCPFPRDQSAFHPLPSIFLQHSQNAEPQPLSERRQLRSQDIWSFSLSRVTLGFDGARRGPKGRTQPFIEPFAMSMWMCQPSAFNCSSFSSPASPSRTNQASSKQEDHLPSSMNHQEEAPLASFHFLVQAITPLKMWLNHYQYVALLRMKDNLARLGAELDRDTQDAKQAHGQQTEPPSVCLALLVDSVEMGLLLPPASTEPEEEVPHTPETDSPSMTDYDISPTHHSTDPRLLEDSGIGNGVTTAGTTSNAAFEQEETDAVVEEACEAVEEALEEEDVPILSPPLSPGQPTGLSRDPSAFSLEGELSSAINATKDVTKDAISASLDLTKGAFSITKDAFSMLSRGSGMSKLFTPQAK